MAPRYNFKSKNHCCDRCCNPYGLPKHHRRRGLRRITLNFTKTFPNLNLTTDHYVCTKCRFQMQLDMKAVRDAVKDTTCTEPTLVKDEIEIKEEFYDNLEEHKDENWEEFSDDTASNDQPMHFAADEESKSLTFPSNSEKIFNNTEQQVVKVVTAKSLFANDYDNIEDEISKPLPKKDESIQQNNAVDSKFANDTSDVFEKNNSDMKKVIAENKQRKINETVNEIQVDNEPDGKVEAKFTKICKACNIETEFDVANKCLKCSKLTIFRCNLCSKYFANYQKVTHHLWTECEFNKWYPCSKCDFKTPCKFERLVHAAKCHSEIDPLTLRKIRKSFTRKKDSPHHTNERTNGSLVINPLSKIPWE